ncbi:MAG TPA: cell division protein FtsH, partial [Patescibacteria group bacterium]|nr:cell division protein FtsH [Patescibacteria group bacterium]
MDKKPRKPAGDKPGANRRSMKNVGFIALIVLFGLIIFAAYNQPSTLKQIPITSAVQQANHGEYASIMVTNGNELQITKKGDNHPTLKTFLEPNATLKDEGFDYSKVQIQTTSTSSGNSAWLSLLEQTVIPVLLIGGLLYLMLRSAQGQGNQALSFGKSRARLYGNEKDKVIFRDIAGSDEAKQDLEEVVEFLKFPKKFAGMG